MNRLKKLQWLDFQKAQRMVGKLKEDVIIIKNTKKFRDITDIRKLFNF